MAVMLPDDLIRVLGWLGLDWPDIDEDEVDRAAGHLRQLADDLDVLVTTMDSLVNDDVLTAMRGSESGAAYVASWNANRENLRELTEVLPEAATALGAFAHVVVGLKLQFLAKLTTALAQLGPLVAMGPLGAGAAAARILTMKLALGALVDAAVSEALRYVNGWFMPILVERVSALLRKVVDFPMVEGTAVDADEVHFDLEALDRAAEAMDQYAEDGERIFTDFLANISDLKLTG